jgi:hypothetical protein
MARSQILIDVKFPLPAANQLQKSNFQTSCKKSYIYISPFIITQKAAKVKFSVQLQISIGKPTTNQNLIFSQIFYIIYI